MTIERFFVGSLLLGFWLLLTHGDGYSFIVGAFFIPLSIYVSVVLTRQTESVPIQTAINFKQIPSFILFFIKYSFKGGMDTAMRAFARTLNIKPQFIHYPIHNLPPGTPMNLFMNLVSLLPGSVSVIREPKGVLVHVLAKTKHTVNELSACEKAVCELFSVEYLVDFKNIDDNSSLNNAKREIR